MSGAPGPYPLSTENSPEQEAESATDTLAQTAAPFKVVLYNDEEHTYDYVVEMLTHVCRLSRDNAFRCAVEVDLTGRTVVYYGSRSECQSMCSQILAYGPDHRLPHSMASMNAEVQEH
jgi:ATP-dependent Clp protease adaptor protein ClpS